MAINRTFSAHAALFLVNLLYAASHVLAKGVMPKYLDPTVFIAFRAVGATVLFWIIAIFIRTEKIQRTDYVRFFLCGLLGVTINQLFFFHGLNLSSSINSGIIMAFNPVLVVIISYFLVKDKLTTNRLFGILLGCIGAILLTWKGGTGKGDSTLGDIFLFINALSYAFYLVLAKPLMQRYSPLTVITYVFSIGSFFVLLFPPTISGLLTTNFSVIPATAWIKIAYVVVGVTFLTYLLTMYGLKYLSASISSSYIYLQPVLVIIFAYVLSFLGVAEDYTQTITLEKIGYMCIIFVGVYLTSRTQPKS